MRELKFRQWLSDFNKFHYFCFSEGHCDGVVSCNLSQDPIMQYTGLKDKNGIEIYESMEINNKYKVEYIGCKYVLTDMSNNDIMDISEVIKNENGIEVTKEYSEI